MGGGGAEIEMGESKIKVLILAVYRPVIHESHTFHAIFIKTFIKVIHVLAKHISCNLH